MSHRNTTLALLLSLHSAAVCAEDIQYVTDVFDVTMRSGSSTSHKILRMVPSGTRLIVLDKKGTKGYIRVETPSGQIGWILQRFLTEERSAREQLEALQDRLQQSGDQSSELETANNTLREQLSIATEKAQTSQTEQSRLNEELEKLKADTRNARDILSENQRLKQAVEQLTEENYGLASKNESLASRVEQDWFIRGAGVIVGGIIIGLTLPLLRFRRKRSSW